MKLQILLSKILAGFAVLIFLSCQQSVPSDDQETGTLKSVATFPVGIGIDSGLMLNNSTYASIVKDEFDALTAEYQMKQGPIVQSDGSFEYSTADQIVEFAQKEGMSIHGHTLAWHQNNNGNYLRSLVGNGSEQDSTAVADFLHRYIDSTVSRYQGQVASWDVVNEPVDNGTGDIRSNPSPGESTEGDVFYWAEFMGERYIPLAFQWADEIAPKADLYINDYNLESDPKKRAGFIRLVNKLLEDDVPIDGVGTQMHISINTSQEGIDRAFQELASTGLKVKVTELDVKINPDNEKNFTPSEETLTAQRIMYNYVAWSYIQNVPEDQRAGISVWNLKDDSSWIVTTQDRDDYPTLFDSSYSKKPAYNGFKKGLRGEKPNPSRN